MEIVHYFEQLMGNLTSSLPSIVGALLVIIIGYFVAKLVKRIVKKALSAVHLDDRLGSNNKVSLEDLFAKIAYYLIQIYVLIIALDLLGVEGVLDPLKNMLNNFIGYIPNVIGAGVIGYIGYTLANILADGSSSITNYVDSLSEKVNLSGKVNLVKLVKQVVFLLVFVPILIVALNTLKISTISEPATLMLQNMMSAIPMILSAAIIIGVFYLAAKFVSTWLTEIISSVGGDEFAEQTGISGVLGKYSLSNLIGKLAFFFIMFSGLVAGTDKLNIPEFSGILRNVFEISGQIFFAVVIVAVGNYLANLVKNNMLAKNGSNTMLATIVQYAILGIFLAMALRGIGIADSIVDLAFGLVLGAIAVAFALSFGLGGREAAGKALEEWFKKLKS